MPLCRDIFSLNLAGGYEKTTGVGRTSVLWFGSQTESYSPLAVIVLTNAG